jgi:hypothetical protein
MTYVPSRPPQLQTLADLQKWVEEELQAIARDQGETIALELRPIFVAPAKPREGMIIYADGTSFNPGAGEGPYVYKNGNWVIMI